MVSSASPDERASSSSCGGVRARSAGQAPGLAPRASKWLPCQSRCRFRSGRSPVFMQSGSRSGGARVSPPVCARRGGNLESTRAACDLSPNVRRGRVRRSPHAAAGGGLDLVSRVAPPIRVGLWSCVTMVSGRFRPVERGVRFGRHLPTARARTSILGAVVRCGQTPVGVSSPRPAAGERTSSLGGDNSCMATILQLLSRRMSE